MPWCRAALAAGPADLRRRLGVDEHRPPVDDGHDIGSPARKLGPHSRGLAGRVRHDNDDRRSLRDTDHLVRQHVDGLGQRRPERDRHDADGTGVGHFHNEGPGEGAAHRHPRTLEVGTDGLRPVPVATGVETGAEAAGTSSRGAMTKAAVKARTLTPPTVRVNRCRMTAPPIDP